MKQLVTLLIVLLTAPIAALAQNGEVRYFEVPEPIDMNGIRPVIDAVKDLDPWGEVWFHNDEMTIIQVKANPSVSNAELKAGIQANGVALRAEDPVITPQAPVTTTPEGKPMYVVTDDAEGDHSRYEQAVQQWNSLNPTEPMAMPLPAGDDQ